MESLASYVSECRPKIQGAGDVAELLRPVFAGLQQEEFHVILLNAKHAVLRDIMVTRGLVDRTQIHAREVFRDAICASCTSILLAHNHPSGDPTPSFEDVACTRSLVEAGKIVGIDVLDHVIIAGDKHLSLREAALL